MNNTIQFLKTLNVRSGGIAKLPFHAAHVKWHSVASQFQCHQWLNYVSAGAWWIIKVYFWNYKQNVIGKYKWSRPLYVVRLNTKYLPLLLGFLWFFYCRLMLHSVRASTHKLAWWYTLLLWIPSGHWNPKCTCHLQEHVLECEGIGRQVLCKDRSLHLVNFIICLYSLTTCSLYALGSAQSIQCYWCRWQWAVSSANWLYQIIGSFVDNCLTVL